MREEDARLANNLWRRQQVFAGSSSAPAVLQVYLCLQLRFPGQQHGQMHRGSLELQIAMTTLQPSLSTAYHMSRLGLQQHALIGTGRLLQPCMSKCACGVIEAATDTWPD